MSKRAVLPAIISALVAVFAIGGCGGGGQAGSGGEERIDFTFHTGSQGGGYQTFANMFVEEWETEIEGFSTSTVSGGSFTNAVKVEQSQNGQDMGASFTTVLFDGVNHQGDFPEAVDGPLENLRAIARLNRQSVWLAPTVANAVPEGVTTVGEFLEQQPSITIFNKDRGTGGEIATRRLLDAYGVSYEDFESWGGGVNFSSTSDGVSAVVNGQAQGVWQSYVPRAADLQELSGSRDIVYLEVEEDIIQKLNEEYGFLPFTAPVDEWFGAPEPVDTFMEDTVVYVHKDAPEDVVKEMTRIVLENKEKWVRGQKAFETFEPENAWKDTVVPLHPGAEEAYKELGYME
jgi:TRAP transporter TAXI family solute receptor